MSGVDWDAVARRVALLRGLRVTVAAAISVPAVAEAVNAERESHGLATVSLETVAEAFRVAAGACPPGNSEYFDRLVLALAPLAGVFDV